MPTANQVIAALLDRAANTVSGLSLEDIGEDGHQVANKLWKIAAHLRARDRKSVSPDVIRAWARQQGYRVHGTGCVSREIAAEYYSAVTQPARGGEEP